MVGMSVKCYNAHKKKTHTQSGHEIANYKIKASKELLTSQELFGEFLEKVGFYQSVSHHMSMPGNHRGYEPRICLHLY